VRTVGRGAAGDAARGRAHAADAAVAGIEGAGVAVVRTVGRGAAGDAARGRPHAADAAVAGVEGAGVAVVRTGGRGAAGEAAAVAHVDRAGVVVVAENGPALVTDAVAVVVLAVAELDVTAARDVEVRLAARLVGVGRERARGIGEVRIAAGRARIGGHGHGDR